LRQGVTLESLFVFFVFCNSSYNCDGGVGGRVFVMADFGETSRSLVLAIMATYSGNAFRWKKADLHCGGGST
jgi:hypothetical protein